MRGLLLLAAPVLAAAAPAPSPLAYEQAPIHYSRSVPHDAVARLVARIVTGEVKLSGSDREILRGVLRALDVPEASQLLVFSKTSLQEPLIQPDNPRAIYFSDSVYVADVPGGLIEAAAVDPALGPVFYSFDPQDARDGRRSFVRERTCLRCHGGTFSREYPGLIERSVIASAGGEVLNPDTENFVSEETPFNRRWGGWYVTGYDGTEDHCGNAFGAAKGDGAWFVPTSDRPADLSQRLGTSKYLATTSDLEALLVFQHQLDMHNSLTRSAQRVWRALAAGAGSPAADAALAAAAQDVVDHLLFRGAAPLPAGIRADRAFQAAFLRDARRDRRGDSLKDFSLHGRLFANRCSFLIYSDSFAALPPPLKACVFAGLRAALRDDDPQRRYAYLGKDERRRIVDVLSATLPEAGLTSDGIVRR